MGIDSLFITNNKTETLTAVKHWGPETDPSICEKVFEKHHEAIKKNTRGDALAIDGKDYAFFQSHGELTYIATPRLLLLRQVLAHAADARGELRDAVVVLVQHFLGHFVHSFLHLGDLRCQILIFLLVLLL